MCSDKQSPTNFSTLPTELQLLIYRYVIDDEARSPRIHALYPVSEDASVYISNQEVPVLMHLNSTTRSMYLQTIKPTYIYGTYINFQIDTLYLATCPDIPFASTTPSSPSIAHQTKIEHKDRDGFEVCKSLGKDKTLVGNVKRVAVNDSFWLRPETVTRSIVVEAWNVLVKDGLGGGLEELCIVFGSPYAAKSANEIKDVKSISMACECKDRKGSENVDSDIEVEKVDKRRKQVRFETIGYYQKIRNEFGERMEVDPRARRCDEFLRAYLGVSLGESSWMRPVIKYVAYKEI